MGERLFLDANALFSAAYRTPNAMMRLWELEDTRLIASAYVITEARRNLPAHCLSRLEELLASIEIVPDAAISPELIVDLPKKDVPVLAAAIACGATSLVTGDKQHFGRHFGLVLAGVHIETPAMVLARR